MTFPTLFSYDIMSMQRRSSHPMVLRPRPSTIRNLAAVARLGYKAYRSYANTEANSVNSRETLPSGVRDTVPLTSQRDTQEYYRKRPRGRLGRRGRARRFRKKRFSRAVRKVMAPRLGTYQFVKANVGSVAWLINAAVAKGFMLGHTTSAGAGPAQTSLLEASNALFANNASLRGNVGHFLLQTMTMELSILAPSSNTAHCDLDVYTLVCIRDCPQSVANVELQAFYNTIQAQENTVAGVIPVSDAGTGVARSGTTMLPSERGWTPWNSSLGSRYWKVVKKEKILMVPGASTHVQLHKRYSVPKRVTTRRLTEMGYLKGISCAYLIQGFSLWNGTSQPAGTLTFNTEYTYALKYEPNNESTINVLP